MEKVTLEFLFGVNIPWRSDRYLLGQELKGEYEYEEEKWKKKQTQTIQPWKWSGIFGQIEIY